MNWFPIAFASALLSAASAVSQKKVLFKLDVLEFALVISVLNALLTVPFALMADYGTLNAMNVGALFIKSALGAWSFLCVMYALKNMEISGALPLMALSPGIIALFAYFLLGDIMQPLQVGGLVMLLAGTYLLEVKHGQSFFEPFKVMARSQYHHYIFTALALFTVTSLLDKLLLGKYKMPPMPFLVLQQFFYLLVIALVFIVKKGVGGVYKAFTYPREMWLWLGAIALFTLGYRYSLILAVKIAPVAAVLGVKRISVFIAAVTGGRLFKESGLLKKALAAAIIVAGAILIMRD
ncbi:MAG: EamA family transporter [Ignavibacteriales bacterium]|nr:EamA family transporter [Ignavibacteriales bacterium]